MSLTLGETTKQFSNWLYHLALFLTVFENSSSFTSLPTFGIVREFFVDSSSYEEYLIMALICVFLTTNDTEHLLCANWLFGYLLLQSVSCPLFFEFFVILLKSSCLIYGHRLCQGCHKSHLDHHSFVFVICFLNPSS